MNAHTTHVFSGDAAGTAATSAPRASCQRAVDLAGDVFVALPSGTRIYAVRSADSAAVDSVLRHRQQQVRSGYTPQADDRKSIWDFVQLVEMLTRDVDQAWPVGRKDRSLPQLRRFAVKLAATTIALIERIDREA